MTATLIALTKAALIATAIQIFVGALVLKFAASLEDEEGTSFGSLIWASLLLSIVPPLLFRLCLYVPLFGLWLGLAVWFFSSRAIIMGIFEVLEEKAHYIMFTYYMLYIGLVVIVAKVIA
ncbi:hypothetical protein ACFL34_04330 [Candidatus Sumerlaeota bacterium]